MASLATRRGRFRCTRQARRSKPQSAFSLSSAEAPASTESRNEYGRVDLSVTAKPIILRDEVINETQASRRPPDDLSKMRELGARA